MPIDTRLGNRQNIGRPNVGCRENAGLSLKWEKASPQVKWIKGQESICQGFILFSSRVTSVIPQTVCPVSIFPRSTTSYVAYGFPHVILDVHSDGFAGDMISLNSLGERKEQVFPKVKNTKKTAERRGSRGLAICRMPNLDSVWRSAFLTFQVFLLRFLLAGFFRFV